MSDETPAKPAPSPRETPAKPKPRPDLSNPNTTNPETGQPISK